MITFKHAGVITFFSAKCTEVKFIRMTSPLNRWITYHGNIEISKIAFSYLYFEVYYIKQKWERVCIIKKTFYPCHHPQCYQSLGAIFPASVKPSVFWGNWSTSWWRNPAFETELSPRCSSRGILPNAKLRNGNFRTRIALIICLITSLLMERSSLEQPPSKVR